MKTIPTQSENPNPAMTHFIRLWFLGYILPITLIWAGVIPFVLRYPVLILVTAGLVVYLRRRGHRPGDLGFRQDTWVRAAFWHGTLTVAGIAAVSALLLAGLITRHPMPLPHMALFFVFYALFSSPVQEFLFRSLLFAEMNDAGIKSRFAQVAITAVTFSYVHIIYPNPAIWGSTLLIGILWGLIYSRHPNYWAVTLSHAVLGATAITLGLIWY